MKKYMIKFTIYIIIFILIISNIVLLKLYLNEKEVRQIYENGVRNRIDETLYKWYNYINLIQK